MTIILILLMIILSIGIASYIYRDGIVSWAKKHKKQLLGFGVVSSMVLAGATVLIPTGDAPSGNWVIDGDTVSWENQYGRLEVTPHTSKNIIRQIQYCNITWKYPDNNIDVAFRFDDELTGYKNIWMWQNISHDVTVPDYGDINANYTINNITSFTVLTGTPEYVDYGDNTSNHYYNGTTTNDSYIIGFDSFDWLNPWHTNATFYYVYYGQTGSHIEQQYWFDWNSKKSAFQHTIYNDKHYYYVTDLSIIQDKTYSFKWQYNTPVNTNGKWDLMAKLSSDTIQEALQSDRYIMIDPWWESDWDYYKQITIDSIDQVDATLTNFPILVNITDSDLASKALDNGSDIAFTLIDNSTQLNHEIESFDGGTGALVAWVNVTSLSHDSDLVINMYYGNVGASNQQNPTGTWDSNYIRVYHMDDLTTSTIDDSTETSDGTKLSANNPLKYSDGIVDDGQDFSSDYIIFGGIEDIPPDYTVEFWASPDNIADSNGAIFITVPPYFAFGFYVTADEIIIGNSAFRKGFDDISAYLTNDVWNYWTGVVDASNDMDLYRDGKLMVLDDVVNYFSSFDYDRMGCRDSSATDGTNTLSRYLDGKLDEVRISDILRSADWINTCYNTVNNASVDCANPFLSIGSEQTEGAGWTNSNPVNSNPIPVNTATDISVSLSQLNITVNDANGANQTMNITFRTNASGTWLDADTNSSVANGTYYCINTSWIDTEETKYFWSVNTSDGVGGWDNDTYYFITRWSGWKHYKTATISDKIDDYAMRLIVGKETDVGDVNCTGNCQDDFGDIRFTDSDNNTIAYWMQNYTSSVQATFWINNSANSSSINMYYYTSDTSLTTSNGTNTFDIFDDFESYSINDDPDGINGWVTIQGDGYAKIVANPDGTGNVLGLYDGGAGFQANNYFTVQYLDVRCSALARFDGHSASYYYCIMYDDIDGTPITYTRGGSGDADLEYYNGAVYVDFVPGFTFADNVWVRLREMVTFSGTDDLDVVLNEKTNYDGAVRAVPNTYLDRRQFASPAAGHYYWVDDFWVDGFTSGTEPSFSSFGSEQTEVTNTAPTQSGESPTNTSIDISVTPSLYVICLDDDADNMNATWMSNSSGAWVQFASNGTIANNTNITQSFTNATGYSTKYWWSVNLTDGTDWNNETYHFTTKAEIYNATIRNDGIDFFVWLGDNSSAWNVSQQITGFDESSEYISIWKSATQYEYYDTGDNTGLEYVGTNYMAQTFTIGTTGDNTAFDVLSVYLKLYKSGNPGTIFCNISAVDNEQKPTGSVLSAGTYDGNSITTTSTGLWYRINMSQYELQPSTIYAINLSCPSGSLGSNTIIWRVDNTPTYTGGTAMTFSAGPWSNESSDAMFRICGDYVEYDFPLWNYYWGDNTGSNFTVKTFDVIRTYLTDSGTQTINTTVNPDMDYDASYSYTWSNSSINYGYNYTAFNRVTNTSLSAINASVTLQNGEAIGLWNKTTYTWNWFLPTFYEVDVTVPRWSIIISKVEDTEVYST